MLNTDRRPLTEGDFGGYLPLYGGMLTEGDFWPRQAEDGYTIYRGQDGVMDYTRPVAIMELDSNSIVIAGQSLPASSQWWYVRRKVKGCCGLESDDSVPCKVRIGADGQMIGNAPNPPVDLTAELMAGGRVRLRWRYVPGGQDTPAAGFAVYVQMADIPLSVMNWYRKPLSEGDLGRYWKIVRGCCVRVILVLMASGLTTRFRAGLSWAGSLAIMCLYGKVPH